MLLGVAVIKYEVTGKVPKALLEQYLSFLSGHVERVIQSDGFLDSQIVLESPEPDPNSFVQVRTSYGVVSSETLEHYLDTRAPQLRQETIDLFGNQIEFSRKVWEVVNTTSCIHK